MIYAATEGPCTLIVEPDDDPVDPRIDCDPFGHMVCWHRRYSLGDGHHYATPEDFLRDLYRKSIRDGGKRLVQFLKSGDARGAKLIYNRSSREWELHFCYYLRTVPGKSEPSWELEQSAPKEQLNNSGWFFEDMLDALTIDDLKQLLSEQKDILILPLYLYDHSGLSISTGSFVGRAHHAEWDSGQVGYIYAEHDDILNNFGEITPDTIRQAKECLEGEVEAYDAFLRGDCWGYRAFMYGHEMDACRGFLGDIDDVKPDIASSLVDGWNQLVGKLAPRYQSAKEYLYDAAVA